MAGEVYKFQMGTVWTGNSDGSGTASGDGWSFDFGAPTHFGGQAGRTNPEELLLTAVATCYCITLALLAERKRLSPNPLQRIEMAVTGEVERQLGGTLKFTTIRLAPVLIAPGADSTQVSALTDAAQKAEQYCPISNAVRGNVGIEVVAEVRV